MAGGSSGRSASSSVSLTKALLIRSPCPGPTPTTYHTSGGQRPLLIISLWLEPAQTRKREAKRLRHSLVRMPACACGQHHCLHRPPAGSEVADAPGRLRREERGPKLRRKIRHERRGWSLHRRYRNRPRRLFDRLRLSRLRSYRRISWRLRLSRLLSHCYLHSAFALL